MTFEARKDTREALERGEWVFVDETPELMKTLSILADPDLTAAQRMRYFQDKRLAKECHACGHPGYMHTHAEEQYETGDYGVALYEAGDITCEDDCYGCGWYEGDNY